jgi:hypothetical protein
MFWTTNLVYERMRRDQANVFRARLAAQHRNDASAPDTNDTREPAPKHPTRRSLRGSWFPGRAITVPG